MNKQTNTRASTLRVVNSKVKQPGKLPVKKASAKLKGKLMISKNGTQASREEAKRNPRGRKVRNQLDSRRRRAASSSSSSSSSSA
jgi:16S rRNA C1402 N4-methylase RsmH